MPLWQKVEFKEWCKSNDSQTLNSDSSPKMTLAVQSSSKLFQLNLRVTHTGAVKKEIKYLQNQFK